MRPLIITQKMDRSDDVLGFVHGWVTEFAKQSDQVTVICLFEGEHDLPKNVKVLSLGKESGSSKLSRLARFYKYIFRFRNEYDQVFVHMNQIYIILGALLWRMWGKTVGLWYAHGSVTTSLKVAEKLTNIVFTSTESGFRIKSPKKMVVGQGIDTNLFKPSGDVREDGIFRIVSVGRISPKKDYKTLIEAVGLLEDKANLEVKIYGQIGLAEQKDYFDELQKLVKEKNLEDVIDFFGPVPNFELPKKLQESDLLINQGHTGSLDKVMPEAMAASLPVLTCNEAMLEVFGSYTDLLMYKKRNPQELADKIQKIRSMDISERQKIGSDLREIVKKDHALDRLIKTILGIYKKHV